jgi:hypothetical protein
MVEASLKAVGLNPILDSAITPCHVNDNQGELFYEQFSLSGNLRSRSGAYPAKNLNFLLNHVTKVTDAAPLRTG